MAHFTAFLLFTLVSAIWAANLDSLQFKSDKLVCPDGQFSCDDQSTCCQLPNGEWSCCVYAHAQCCGDHTHCCPQGSVCDVDKKSCRSTAENYTVPAVRTKSRTALMQSTNSKVDSSTIVGLTCPDRSLCPYAGAACCRQYSGRYSCCNYPLNVCCDDGLHCCHVGTVCDPVHYVCIPYPSSTANWTHSWTEMTPAQRLSPLDALIPQPAVAVDEAFMENDKKPTHTDTDDHTCCVDEAGRKGRCILDGSEAVCCEDGLHCCPKGTTCDVARGQCSVQKMQTPVIPWSTKSGLLFDTVCPDGESECPSENTCCPVSGTQWGCCPLASAVCCPDMKHCCPYGTHCTPGGSCATNLQSTRIPWSTLVFDDSH